MASFTFSILNYNGDKTHPRHLCKTGWTDRGTVVILRSHGPRESCVRWGCISPNGNGQFWWIGSHIVKYRHFLPWAVQKRLNRSICRLGCGLKWAEGCTSSIVFARWCQCTIVGGYVAATWRMSLSHPSTAAMRLTSHYLDHLLSLDTPT